MADHITETGAPRNPHRRSVLAGFGGSALTGGVLGHGLLSASTALAQTPGTAPASAAAGPKVFMDYDQAALDAAYNQLAYAPNADKVIKRWISNSRLAAARLPPPQRIAYGDKPIEQLDIYKASAPKAPVVFFIHGGAWRSTTAQDYVFLADMILGAGMTLVMPDFDAVQNVGGKLEVMADQVRRALVWTAKNAASFGADPARLYVAGQSSGGHFAGVILTTDWTAVGLSPGLVKGGLCISGMYDLTPVRLSARGSYVAFTDATVETLSPIRHLDRLTAPMVVAYGSDETPEFQRQNRAFAAAIQAAGKPVELVTGENYNHFEFLETLANPYGILGRALLKLTGREATAHP